MIRHIISENQNIKQVAEYYEIPPQVLIEFNNLKTPKDFISSQIIFIPNPKEFKERMQYKAKKEGK